MPTPVTAIATPTPTPPKPTSTSVPPTSTPAPQPTVSAAASPTSGSVPATATPIPPTPSSTPTPTPTPVTLDIKSFTHLGLTIPVGTTVTWKNLDTVPHTSTAGVPNNPDPDNWDSGNILANAIFSFTFDNTGTFAYFCRIHPTIMRATVTVGGPWTRVSVLSNDDQPSGSGGGGGGGGIYGYE